VIRPLTCPICQKFVPAPSEETRGTFPFCSERCRQVDLLRWSEGKYAIVEPLTPEKLLEEALSEEEREETGEGSR
jgi:endogenous inhibitor of DNA gyrase (YacG/DUF329 family)